MIDDRRGSGGGGGGLGGLGGMLGGGGGGRGGGIGLPGKMGGGIIGIIVMLAILVLPRLLNGSGESSNNAVDSGSQGGGSGNECDTETAQIVCGATEDVQTFWEAELPTYGPAYEITQTVFFSGSTTTACGGAESSTGPFYCPADRLVYFDLDFLVQLQDQVGAEGDLAAAYIVAHEYGHHVQTLTGASAKMRELQQQNPDRANEYSVALELQADCLAGVWANDARSRGQFESDKEIEEALDAAEAVGDDRISQGRADRDSFTHGSSEERKAWFQKGYTSGDLNNCDTFAGLT